MTVSIRFGALLRTATNSLFGSLLIVSLCSTACGDHVWHSNRGGRHTRPPPGEWLKGDLHLHSSHSTDALDNPMHEVIAKAEAFGMDYFTFTDHDNHVSGNITTWDDPAHVSDRMLTLFGAEYTTARAHVNFFSAARWEHLALWALRDGEAKPYLDEAHRQGLHASINHPFSGDPWEHSFDLDFDSIEIWNALVFLPGNGETVKKWDELLSNGRRIPGRGGSDVHHQQGPESTILNVGNPTTWIRARSRSAESILEALAAGHVSISYAPLAERIDFTADADGDGEHEMIMGENLVSRGKSIEFRVEIAGFRDGATYRVTVIKNGARFREVALTQPSTTFEDTPAKGERAYYRVEVRGDTPEVPSNFAALYAGLIGMTNPIYVGYE
ncbi:MAG TPA: CehA/McbA family metallohydrolase [Polyangiaceae bacterium]|nr:CehA/McbA family metallohydrolase [Polyangiaceae bacterium]